MRKTEEILIEMDNVQAQYPELSTLSSTSNTSIFGLMRLMWAQLVQLVEANWENFLIKVEQRIAETKPGGMYWYVEQAKLFQLGDAVTVINGQVAYPVIDTEKRIIVQAAISESVTTGRLTLRLVKKTGSELEALSESELEAAKSYVQKYKYAGVVVDVRSIAADDLRLTATVKVDRQIISSTGILLADGVSIPVVAAINNYLATLPYDSMVNNTSLTDAVQAVPGVKDFTITSSDMKRPVVASWTSYTNEVLSEAGYAILNGGSVLTYTY